MAHLFLCSLSLPSPYDIDPQLPQGKGETHPMARPRIRGSRWSLNQVATEAGASRGITRAALAEGWLPSDGPYAETDIVILRLASAWMRAFPDDKGPRSSPLADTAKNLASAVVLDPRSAAETVMVATTQHARIVSSMQAVGSVIGAAGAEVAVVFPVGAWQRMLPSQRRAGLLFTPDPDFPTSDRGSSGVLPQDVVAPEPAGDLWDDPPPPQPSASDIPNKTPTRESLSTSPRDTDMTAYQAFTRARDAIVSKAHAAHPQPYDSPGEPW